MGIESLLNSRIRELVSILDAFEANQKIHFSKCAELIVTAINNKNTIFWCGNGGSAAESSHLAAELIGRFRANRIPLPSISLNSDTSVLTCIANDFGYETVYSRQLQGLAKKDDLLICLSTTGKSSNIVNVLKTAQLIGMSTICFLGGDGGEAASLGTISIIIDSTDTARIQEMHLLLGHLLCEYAESNLMRK